MSDFTGYLEGEIAEWMVKDTQMPTPPANVYVGLHTSDPGNTPDGSTEVGASDYARLSTAPGDWSVLSGDGPTTFENAVELLFPAAENNWGTISHVMLWDDTLANGGNAIAKYDVSTPKSIDTNDEARFPANDLSFDID